jgi:hypothetical protein
MGRNDQPARRSFPLDQLRTQSPNLPCAPLRAHESTHFEECVLHKIAGFNYRFVSICLADFAVSSIITSAGRGRTADSDTLCLEVPSSPTLYTAFSRIHAVRAH